MSKVHQRPVRVGCKNLWITSQQFSTTGDGSCDSEHVRHRAARLEASSAENPFLTRQIELQDAPQFSHYAPRVFSSRAVLKDVRDFAEADPGS